MSTIIINDDLSVKIVSSDGLSHCNLIENPKTLKPFNSRYNAQIFAERIQDNPKYFSKIVIVEPVYRKVLTPVEFKMMFTVQERLATKEIIAAGDPLLSDVMEILNDTRLHDVDLNIKSNIDVLDYMVSLEILTPERKDEILKGILED